MCSDHRLAEDPRGHVWSLIFLNQINHTVVSVIFSLFQGISLLWPFFFAHHFKCVDLVLGFAAGLTVALKTSPQSVACSVWYSAPVFFTLVTSLWLAVHLTFPAVFFNKASKHSPCLLFRGFRLRLTRAGIADGDKNSSLLQNQIHEKIPDAPSEPEKKYLRDTWRRADSVKNTRIGTWKCELTCRLKLSHLTSTGG